MARKKASLIAQLGTKEGELLNAADVAAEQADWHAAQVGILKSEASTAKKQAAAVDAALAILNEAGVVL